MNYDEFKKEIISLLEERYGDDAKIDLQSVRKNNCVRDGISIKLNESNISPLIYLDDVFSDYEDKRWTIEEAVTHITELNERHLASDVPFINDIMDNISEWKYAKKHVYPMLVSRKNNCEYLKDLVYKPFLDFAIVYYISPEDKSYSVKISSQLLKEYGVSADELDVQARKNNSADKYNIADMYNTLLKMTGGKKNDEFEALKDNENGPCFYILSSESIQYGAAGILNPKVLSKAEELIGSSRFYILPSSIYEVILTPDDYISKEELNQMVVTVNETELSKQDILSDHVYFYDGGELSIAA